MDPHRAPELDLDRIAADLAGVETALAELEDGTYVGDVLTPPTAATDVAAGTEPDPG